jgi:hypothetical protein
MSWRHLTRDIALWLPVGAIPIANGAVRMFLYGRWIGEPLSSLVSSALDVSLIIAYAGLVQRRWPVTTRRGAAGRGVLWTALTTSNHFALGAFVFGITLPALLAKYDLLGGETWLLVSFAIFAAPAVAMWRAGERRSPSRL